MKEFDNLESFRTAALATSLDQDWESEKVNLMTLHASKGLEFNIFIYQVGKKDYFTSKKYWGKRRSRFKEGDLRIFGITRAKRSQKYPSQWMNSTKAIGWIV